ncbi:MAG TPA: methyltransferase domain-containing protein [Kofleriaceae bacterium]|nr:methyltransferase domain-containing protein [Kofleriaceae bacterium]
MTSSAAEGSMGAWLRRLPTYLYLIDLLPGKRVLEVGCGVGDGAQFLADHGAARVVGVDRSMASINEARNRHRQTNLEFRCEEIGSIELDDGSFDCIFVPDGIEVLRRGSVLGELRRLLAAGGHLVVCGQSADRRGSPGGASFYEFRERLERLFAPVRMVAQAPFVGFSLVEYAGSSAGGDDPLVETNLDTSLMELSGGEPEPSDYVAVCGGPARRVRGYTVVQVPERDGVEAVAIAAGARQASGEAAPGLPGAAGGAVLVAPGAGDAPAVPGAGGAPGWSGGASAPGWPGAGDAPGLPGAGGAPGWSGGASAPAWPGAGDAPGVPGAAGGPGAAGAPPAAGAVGAFDAAVEAAQTGADLPAAATDMATADAAGDALLVHELRLRLETAIADRARAQAHADERRAQADESRAQADRSRAQADELRAEVDDLRRQLVETADMVESRPASGPSASEQIAEALAAHRDAVRSLEIAVEEGEAYAEELRSELEQAAGQAQTESSGRQRGEARAERLDAELREWRTRASTAEGKLLRLAREADAARGEPGRGEPARSEPARPATPPSPDGADLARVADLEAELARARRGWQDAETALEAMRAERSQLRERRDGNGEAQTAAAAAAATIGRDVARKLARFELEVESGRNLIQQVEGGLAELERQVARDAAERAPSAWAAHRDQQLRELSAELGIKDAEIMILHIGVSALRARMRELVGDVRRTAGQARDRSRPELLELVEQLGDRAASFEERDEPPTG